MRLAFFCRRVYHSGVVGLKNPCRDVVLSGRSATCWPCMKTPNNLLRDEDYRGTSGTHGHDWLPDPFAYGLKHSNLHQAADS